jgi:hypothetical protein
MFLFCPRLLFSTFVATWTSLVSGLSHMSVANEVLLVQASLKVLISLEAPGEELSLVTIEGEFSCANDSRNRTW